jgi:ABC-type phosphate transport system substrate-binding protein
MTGSIDLYQEYPCSRNTPLSCDILLQTAQEVKGAKFCLECGFPATLPLSTEIRGQRGTYQLTSFLGARGRGRLYAGKQLQNSQPVVIKEYLLPNRCFNAEETLAIKAMFAQVATIDLADQKSQDFRAISGWEAIADEKGERCYLILQCPPIDRTLSRYLREHPAMNAAQVRDVLNQILQTLEFLHAQTVKVSPRQPQQQLVHGNLNLDSIEIEFQGDREFYIYLSDLALLENLFIPLKANLSTKSDVESDLAASGLVASYLWAGGITNPVTGQPLRPGMDEQWSQSDLGLKQFIHRLVGLEQPFTDAQTARQALLQLPAALGSIDSANESNITNGKTQKWRSKGAIASGLALLLLASAILWRLFAPPQPSGEQASEFRLWYKLLNSFADVSGLPVGKFTYTGERNGSWSLALTEKPESDKPLKDLLERPKADIEANFAYEPIASPNLEQSSQPLQAVVAGKHHFTITSFTPGITDVLVKKQVANDGLLVYVAASKQSTNLPKALNGQISIDQLRQIYTGKLTNWKQLGGLDLPIKPYAATEVEAVQQFKKLVLNDDPQDIALFVANTTSLATEATQKIVLKEFDEGRAGIISFGILSKTWRQCSGYPLAIVDGTKSPIQALVKTDRQPIDPESVNLCDEKKDTYPKVSLFQNKANGYPLSYPLYVVYPNDNDRLLPGLKFSELLLTRQGQCLLAKSGLVPLQPIPNQYLKSKCL